MIKKGDLLLVRNLLDPISWIISWFTHSKWTHVAWCLSDTQLFELRRHGLVIRPINSYYRKFYYKTKLLRLKGIKREDIDKAIKIGLGYTKKRTYFKFLFTLILIGFNYARRRPIMSCSGMIAKCLSQVGFYFKKRKKPLLITPADIDNSKLTKNITAKELF